MTQMLLRPFVRVGSAPPRQAFSQRAARAGSIFAEINFGIQD
jgi:hypothetical protein